MTTELEPIRILMASKARYKRSRVNIHSPELPSDWAPQKIENPKVGFPFSDDSAWQLIADLLENKNQEVEYIILKKPPGKEASVMLHILVQGQTPLYIKVHMGANDKVIGRSFHISDRN